MENKTTPTLTPTSLQNNFILFYLINEILGKINAIDLDEESRYDVVMTQVAYMGNSTTTGGK